jgi:hypothetical protein
MNGTIGTLKTIKVVYLADGFNLAKLVVVYDPPLCGQKINYRNLGYGNPESGKQLVYCIRLCLLLIPIEFQLKRSTDHPSAVQNVNYRNPGYGSPESGN